MPYVRTRHTEGENQSVSQGQWTDITYALEYSDDDGMHPPASNEVVIPQSGWYLVTFHGAWTLELAAGAGGRAFRLYRNGNVVCRGDVYAASPDEVHWTQSLVVLEPFNNGDVLTLQANQTGVSLGAAVRAVGRNTPNLMVATPA